jgi:hypothetical protein
MNMENFKVGDRVVCVDNSQGITKGYYPRLILNREYIVQGTKKCLKCGIQDLDVGLFAERDSSNISVCRCGDNEFRPDGIHWCGSWRFRKVAEKVEYVAVAVSIEIEEPILN